MQIPIEDIRTISLLPIGCEARKRWSEAGERVRSWLDSLTPKPEPAKVTPRIGQIWQKLNMGTKTASKAPRLWIAAVRGSDVLYRLGNEFAPIQRMRITTLHRDWHCLTQEI